VDLNSNTTGEKGPVIFMEQEWWEDSVVGLWYIAIIVNGIGCANLRTFKKMGNLARNEKRVLKWFQVLDNNVNKCHEYWVINVQFT
jgi:hypothetical protein